MEEKFLYVVSDFNDYVYVVRATTERKIAFNNINIEQFICRCCKE